MRLVIDLQGAQGASRWRGIGRLSRELALAMAREAGGHEVLVALNGHFAEAADGLIADFAGIIGRDALRVWYPTGGTAAIEADPALRRAASERIRARFLQSLAPDMVHVSSLFEGASDDVVTSMPEGAAPFPSVATLYDLIPMIRRDQYLDGAWIDAPIRGWYLGMVEQLRRMPGLLGISQSSCQEAIDHLGTPPDQVFNIRAGVAESFRPAPLAGAARDAFLARYGLREGFVLFLGGGDMRKNEAGLIAAYGRLPEALRAGHPLAIVGRVDEMALRAAANAAGVPPGNLILIPFVAEADLPALYSACTLFVFPSLHEGFGLPAAEAMACGAAVIGSDCTSLPEVIGRADALFDPLRPESIAGKMQQALDDADFRRSLTEHGRRQAAQFTWADSARRAWHALETIHARMPSRAPALVPRRRSLAITSPLPPLHSGIANYTRQLLPALATHYDITLVVAEPAEIDPAIGADFPLLGPGEFTAQAARFDRVLHHLGNSEFHRFQLDRLLPQTPGVMVLHDTFLSNILQHLEGVEGSAGSFRQTLLRTHGIAALKALDEHGPSAVARRFPCSLDQIRQSLGLILHSQHALDLVSGFFGPGVAAGVHIVPTSRALGTLPGRADARTRLGLPDAAIVVAAFGGIAATKLPEPLLAGFAASAAARQGAILAMVGAAERPLGKRLATQAEAAGIGPRMMLTGRVTDAGYLDWLAAADIAVQLRTDSRGETSAAAADCLAAGLPTIVNAHGALAELPPEAARILPDRFEPAALAAAIDALAASPDLRRRLGEAGSHYAAAHWSVGKVAGEYHDAIEASYAAAAPGVMAQDVLQALRGAGARTDDPAALQAIGRALAATFRLPRPRRIMLDVSGWSDPFGGAEIRRDWAGLAAAVLTGTTLEDRGELLDWRDGQPVTAWADAAAMLGIPALDDAPAAPPMPGDLLLRPVSALAFWPETAESQSSLAAWAHLGGARVVAVALRQDDLAAFPPARDIDATVALDGLPGAQQSVLIAALLAQVVPGGPEPP